VIYKHKKVETKKSLSIESENVSTKVY